MQQSIRITSAALAHSDSDSILRGVLDPASLNTLQVAPYQRDIQSHAKVRDIMRGFSTPGGVPDIELGMRGHRFTESGGNFFLHDAIYIIDGLQRRTAALEVIKQGIRPRLGVAIHFDTVEPWERKRFELLNTHRTKVSSNLLIRNSAAENPAIKMLKDLTHDSSFALAERVAWGQTKKRGELISGQLLLSTVCRLHRRLGPGLSGSRYDELSSGLETLMPRIGRSVLRDNVKLYWEILDKCFNVRGVEIAHAARHLKGGFLTVLAKVFADHSDFWHDTQLRVSTDQRRRLANFPIDDPTISRLCGSNGQAQTALCIYLTQHMNKGRSSRRLKPYDEPEYVDQDEDSSPLLPFVPARQPETGFVSHARN
jgi:hypothetical protein